MEIPNILHKVHVSVTSIHIVDCEIKRGCLVFKHDDLFNTSRRIVTLVQDMCIEALKLTRGAFYTEEIESLL